MTEGELGFNAQLPVDPLLRASGRPDVNVVVADGAGLDVGGIVAPLQLPNERKAAKLIV